MKRYFALILAFTLLIPVLALPAMAAEEPVEYVFARDGSTLVCDGEIPLGTYEVLFSGTYSSAPFEFLFGPVSLRDTLTIGSVVRSFFNFIDLSDMYVKLGIPSGSRTSDFRITITTRYRSDGSPYSVFGVTNSYAGGSSSWGLSRLDSVTLRKVDFLSIVSDLSMDSVVSQVVSLLPLVLGAIICFIGLRKGIAYVRRFLGNA